MTIHHRSRLFLPPKGSDIPPMRAESVATARHCNCQAMVGVRLDTGEAALSGAPCKRSHTPLIRDFLDRYKQSLEHPTAEAAIVVAQQLLYEAEDAFTHTGH